MFPFEIRLTCQLKFRRGCEKNIPRRYGKVAISNCAAHEFSNIGLFNLRCSGPAEKLLALHVSHLQPNLIGYRELVSGFAPLGALNGFDAEIGRKTCEIFLDL